MGPTVVPASQWRRQTWQPLPSIRTPAAEMWLHHSGPRQSKKFQTLVGNERYHVVTLGWRALGYSFAVNVGERDGKFGRIYEGRGWGRQGGHTAGRNTVSHGILLVGDWSVATPVERAAAVESVLWLVEDGAARGLTVRTVSGGHRDAPGASTLCPGAAGMHVVAEVRRRLSEPSDVSVEDLESDVKLVHIDRRGGVAYVADVKAKTLWPLSARWQAEAVTGDEDWARNTVVVSRREVVSSGWTIAG